MADGAGANDVVNNYVTYFNLLMKSAQDTLSSADSNTVRTLAALCPYTSGSVIYQAWSFYSMVFKELPPYYGSCGEDTSGSSRHSQFGMSPISGSDDPRQNYKLNPNPSDGNIILVQEIRDASPIKATVYNAMGIAVTNFTLQFNSFALPLSIFQI